MLIRSYSFEYTGGSCTKITTLIAKCKLQTWSEKERRERAEGSQHDWQVNEVEWNPVWRALLLENVILFVQQTTRI